MIIEYTKNMIIEKLRSYKSQKNKLTLIQFELLSFPGFCNDAVLPAMVQDNRLYNPSETMKKQWIYLHRETKRLEFYVSLLSPELRSILLLHYVECKTWSEIEAETGYSYRTVMRRRDEAITQLVAMYNYSFSMKHNRI